MMMTISPADCEYLNMEIEGRDLTNWTPRCPLHPDEKDEDSLFRTQKNLTVVDF